MRKLLKKYRKYIWLYIIIASFLYSCFLGLLVFRSTKIGVIYPNIYIGDINFGDKTKEEAREIINQKGHALLEGGTTLSINGKNVRLNLSQYAADPDLSRNLIEFNSEKTVNKLYSVGRYSHNPFANLKNTIQILLSRKIIHAELELSEDNLLSFLQERLADYETPARNASIEFEGEKINITKEIDGITIDYQNLLQTLKAQLENFQSPYVSVNIFADSAEIKKYEVEDRVSEIKNALDRAPLSIKYKNREWYISKWALKKYLEFAKQEDVAMLVISKEKSAPFFETISKAVDIAAREAKFSVKDGRVTEFQTSRLGIKADIEATRAALNTILTDGFPTVHLIIKNDIPDTTTADANNFGISELLGIGTSDFSGSPYNRIHNIKTGAKILNGLLIEPDEEFSLLDALGEIDKEHGFKPELVIKDNRTIPEYGGGLCQIGTTVFRVAIDTGLPISERRNHSYRVSYYEPAGFDATIYNPSPDLKFINDTPGHILIQTRIEGMKLIFEFWGKKDEREVTYTKPVIENITDPPPVKYIVTTELAPNVKRKVESAHKGAEASFDYIVNYNNEEKENIDITFHSFYRPWAEMWLVGATSTLENS
ncbi:VanW family protein [Patescibacteria group bacterium]